MAANRRPASGPRPGDATGMMKAKQQKENAPAIAEAARGMSLINAPVVERPDEIVDYSGGGNPNTGHEGGARLLSMEDIGADTEVSVDDLPDGDVDVNSLPDGTYDVRPEMVRELDEPASAHQPKAVPRDVIRTGAPTQAPQVEAAFKVMRVNTDLEDVTIGKDNHFTFREGVRYKVPTAVYNHLDEKGYVYH